MQHSEETHRFALIFEGTQDPSPSTLQKVKAVFLADLELPIEKIQAILAELPSVVMGAQSKSELKPAYQKLKGAGAKVSIQDLEAEADGEEMSFEFTLDSHELEEKKKKSASGNRIYALEMGEEAEQTLEEIEAQVLQEIENKTPPSSPEKPAAPSAAQAKANTTQQKEAQGNETLFSLLSEEELKEFHQKRGASTESHRPVFDLDALQSLNDELGAVDMSDIPAAADLTPAPDPFAEVSIEPLIPTLDISKEAAPKSAAEPPPPPPPPPPPQEVAPEEMPATSKATTPEPPSFDLDHEETPQALTPQAAEIKKAEPAPVVPKSPAELPEFNLETEEAHAKEETPPPPPPKEPAAPPVSADLAFQVDEEPHSTPPAAPPPPPENKEPPAPKAAKAPSIETPPPPKEAKKEATEESEPEEAVDEKPLPPPRPAARAKRSKMALDLAVPILLGAIILGLANYFYFSIPRDMPSGLIASEADTLESTIKAASQSPGPVKIPTEAFIVVRGEVSYRVDFTGPRGNFALISLAAKTPPPPPLTKEEIVNGVVRPPWLKRFEVPGLKLERSEDGNFTANGLGIAYLELKGKPFRLSTENEITVQVNPENRTHTVTIKSISREAQHREEPGVSITSNDAGNFFFSLNDTLEGIPLNEEERRSLLQSPQSH